MSTDSPPGRRYLFVVGSGRSGTTLLQAMLMRSPGVFFPPETKFLGITLAHRHALGDIATPDGWTRACDAVWHVIDKDEMKLDRAALHAAIDAAPRTYRGLFVAWLDALAAGREVTTIGEKSPIHTPYVLELLAMFPEARVVHIIRDPRDVAISQREAWGTPTMQAAIRWRRDLTCHQGYERLVDPSRYISVRYEQLVTAPEAVLPSLCAFLGLTYDPAMLAPEGRKEKGFAAREKHKLRTLEPVTSSRVARYRGKLSSGDIAIVEAICGSLMQRLGYPLEHKAAARRAARAALGLARQLPPYAAAHARFRLDLRRNKRATYRPEGRPTR